MNIIKKAAKVAIGSSLFVSSIILNLQSPAIAETVNNKLGDINKEDREAYCASKMEKTKGEIVAVLADTHVLCKVKISFKAYSEEEAQAIAKASAEREGIGGSLELSAKEKNGWEAVYTNQQNSYHLNEWCRQKYAPRFYVFNPIDNNGRIFVGDGGHSCYKTEYK